MENIAKTFYLRLLVVLIAMISPIACVLMIGELGSYSEYWSTDIRPVFIFTNASTSYYLFSVKGWKMTSLFLLLLTAFSYDQYFWTHNIAAILFFIASGLAIMKNRHFQFYILPYLSCLIVLIVFGILWAEICAIFTICLFHFHRMIKFHLLEMKRKNSQ